MALKRYFTAGLCTVHENTGQRETGAHDDKNANDLLERLGFPMGHYESLLQTWTIPSKVVTKNLHVQYIDFIL